MKEFNPTATSYDPRNALWLGKAADLAYQDIASVEQALQGWNVIPLADSVTDTSGFVAGNAEMIVISFRGTEAHKLKDWLTDLNAGHADGPIGKVHKGFYQAISSIWLELSTALRDLRHNDRTLWITGHSLGAALAVLASAKLLRENVVTSIDGLYTFGQPRTGDQDFAAWLDGVMQARMFRFVNNNDIVPHVPLPPLFKHAGSIHYFDSDGKLRTDEGFWQEIKDRLAGKVRSLFDDKLVPDEIADHFMANYLARLTVNVGVQQL